MKHKHLTISALALILMSACTEATGVEPNDLAGTWTATSIVFTSVADPMLTLDLATEGATMSLPLNADSTYSWAFVFPGEPTENETGTYTVSGNTMTINDSSQGSPETFTIVRSGDTLTLTLADVFDFAEGVEVDATVVIVLTR